MNPAATSARVYIPADSAAAAGSCGRLQEPVGAERGTLAAASWGGTKPTVAIISRLGTNRGE